MGGADIIPGVSGGTVALVLGIYARLVSAVSHFDAQAVRLLLGRRFRAAAEHVDLRFLVALGAGILTGVVSLAATMRYLLQEHRGPTMAVFFGLILASSVMVGRLVQANSSAERTRALLVGVAGAFFAYWVVDLDQLRFYDHPAYYFACGSIAICAMILPGISGAYILWLLGAYEAVTGLIDKARHLSMTGEDLLAFAAFACGCALGLLGFSKVLRLLLDQAYSTTLAVLCGFMVGSLRGLWPFQTLLNPEETELKLRDYEAYMPSSFDREVALAFGLMFAAAAALLLLDRFAGQRRKPVVDPQASP